MAALGQDVVLPGRSSSPSPAVITPSEHGGTGPVLCALCLSAPGKYTCPRCNAPYCSLPCYRGARHSACSELFYKEAVLQAVRDREPECTGRRQMEETLLKLREEEAPSDEEGGLWGSLSRQEKEHFNSLLKSGHIGSLVPQWRPWWDSHGCKIQELPEAGPEPCRGASAPTPEPCRGAPTSEPCRGAPTPAPCRGAPTLTPAPCRGAPTSEPCRGAPAPTPEPCRGAPTSEPCRGASAPTPEPCRGVPTSEPCQVAPGPTPEPCRGAPSPTPEPCRGAPAPTCGQDSGTAQQTCHTTKCQANQGQNIQDVSVVPEEVISSEEVQKMASPIVNDSKMLGKKAVVKEEGSATRDRHKISAHNGSREAVDDGMKEDQTLRGDPSVDEKSVDSEVPPLLRSIPPLCSLTRNPSPMVRFTVVNVIYSYSFSLLRHNGDLSDDEILLDFMGTLMSVSGALSGSTVYNSTTHALKSAVRAASDPLVGGDEGVAVLAMEATAKILQSDGGYRYTLAALSHLHNLLGKIRKLVMEDKDTRKGAFNAKKKCLFLAAWVNENGDCLAILSAEVMMEYKQYLKDLKDVEEMSKGLQQVWGGKRPPAKKKLIQEVN